MGQRFTFEENNDPKQTAVEEVVEKQLGNVLGWLSQNPK